MTLFWGGIVVGIVASAVLPGWGKLIVGGAALILSGWLVRITRFARHGVTVPRALPSHGHVRVAHLAVSPASHIRLAPSGVLLAIAAVIFGIWSWHAARRRGLQHLGAAELRTRWTNVRNVSKWGW